MTENIPIQVKSAGFTELFYIRC